LFGLSRPYLFELMLTGKVRSVHLKKEGKDKGIRLIDGAKFARLHWEF
jgi:hypothetical protein